MLWPGASPAALVPTACAHTGATGRPMKASVFIVCRARSARRTGTTSACSQATHSSHCSCWSRGNASASCSRVLIRCHLGRSAIRDELIDGHSVRCTHVFLTPTTESAGESGRTRAKGPAGRSSASEKPCEQKPRTFPISAHSAICHPKGLADLGDGEAAEVAHLDYPDKAGIDCGEPLKGIMYVENLIIGRAELLGVPAIHCLVRRAAAPAFGLALAYVIDHYGTHGRRGVR